MSPTIRIDNEVFEALKTHAEPFIDTPNTVLRRLLDLGETANDRLGLAEELKPERGGEGSRSRQRRRKTKRTRQPRAKTGTILAESEYEIPMLEVIVEHGGRAPAREVLDELETRLGSRLTDVDKQELASGNVRWRNRAQFVRLRLVERGDMVKDSPRGVWEVTEQGRRRATAEAAA